MCKRYVSADRKVRVLKAPTLERYSAWMQGAKVEGETKEVEWEPWCFDGTDGCAGCLVLGNEEMLEDDEPAL